MTIATLSWEQDGVRAHWELNRVAGHHPQAILRVHSEQAKTLNGGTR